MPRQMKFPKVDKKQPSIKNYITVNININTQPVPVRWATSEPKPVPKPEPVQRYVPMYKEFVHNESCSKLRQTLLNAPITRATSFGGSSFMQILMPRKVSLCSFSAVGQTPDPY